MNNRKSYIISLLLALLIGIPGLALAQGAIGVVTALKGKVKLTRGASQTELGFKDSVISRDLISTQEKSLVRILFGGKSSVTVRERSRLRVTGTLRSTGTLRTIHELNDGEILLNVPQRLIRQGDEFQIHTPNALASIRGASLLTRCHPGLELRSFRCSFTTLSGSVIITPAGLRPIALTPNSSVDITGTPTIGLQIGPTVTLSPEQVSQILRESEIRVAVREEPNRKEIGQSHTNQAAQLGTAVVQAITGTPPTAESKELAAAITAEPSEDFKPEDAIKGSQQVKKLDNPASRITDPSEGGTVLPLPIP